MEPGRLLRALNQAQARFAIVGGAAMVMHGSAYVTDDLDIVYARDPDNVKRLIAAIAPFVPRLRTSEGPIDFKFDERTIKNGMNFTLVTALGNLDLLGEISGIGNFDAVIKNTTRLKVGHDVFEVLTL